MLRNTNNTVDNLVCVHIAEVSCVSELVHELGARIRHTYDTRVIQELTYTTAIKYHNTENNRIQIK